MCVWIPSFFCTVCFLWFGLLMLTSQKKMYMHTFFSYCHFTACIVHPLSSLLDFNCNAYHQFLWRKATQMATVSLKQVAFYRNSNLQMPLVRTHFIHLVINVLAMASGLLPSLHSVTIPLPLLFCHPPAIRPCHSNVGSFENISFFQCFGLGSALSWHFRQWFDPRSQHLVSRQHFTTQTIKFLFHGSYITNERYVKENIYIWHDRYLTYRSCFLILLQVLWTTHKRH